MEELPTVVQNTLDDVHARSEKLEKILTERIGYARVTAYVDGVTKIETSWKGMLLLQDLVDGVPHGIPEDR